MLKILENLRRVQNAIFDDENFYVSFAQTLPSI